MALVQVGNNAFAYQGACAIRESERHVHILVPTSEVVNVGVVVSGKPEIIEFRPDRGNLYRLKANDTELFPLSETKMSVNGRRVSVRSLPKEWRSLI
jgi:hypothetical protein